MIKLITFDLDNTLWEVMPVIIRAEKTMRAWLEQRVPAYSTTVTDQQMSELREAALAENPQLICNISDMRLLLLERALTLCGETPGRAAQLAADAFEIFMQGRNAVTLYPGAQAMLEELSSRYRLAALTNGNADVSVMPISRYFEFSMSPEKVQARKPSSKIFAATLQIAKCSASEVIHVGDNLQEDVEGAVAAGWHAVWANIAGEPAPECPSYSAQITRLEDLSRTVEQIG